MIELRNPQKRYLRGLGNGLKPTIHIGKSGLTESLLKAIQEALDDHELIKIRFLEYEREEKKQLIEEISITMDAPMVGSIGHTALFYRPQQNLSERKISLPA
jgi:RNA-binding protein